MKKRLAQVNDDIAAADPLKRVQLIQERIDLEQALSREDETVDITALEKGFVEAAAAYSRSKGISYAAWRELGIPAPTLKKAGISRGAA